MNDSVVVFSYIWYLAEVLMKQEEAHFTVLIIKFVLGQIGWKNNLSELLFYMWLYVHAGIVEALGNSFTPIMYSADRLYNT